MKKIILFELLLITLFLTACTIPSTGIGEVPEMNGLQTLETTVGASIDLLYNVTALDTEDGDLSSEVVILNEDALPIHNGVITFEGTYTIKYAVTDSDNNTVTYNRTLIVSEIQSICSATLEGYTLTFCDDFLAINTSNTNGIDTSKWRFQTGDGSQYGIPGWGNSEAQYYQSDNAYVSNGMLNIEAKNESVGGYFYTSARLWTKDLFYQAFGRFEARIKLPVGNGLWPAFWLMPNDDTYGGWAASGEIDILEARGRIPNVVNGALHFGASWPNNTHVHGAYTLPNNETIADFHTYALEWTPTEIRWYVDDVLFYTVNNWYTDGYPYPAPFDQPFYIILNLAIGGVYDGGILPDASLFNSQVLMQIDYVRVFQFND